MTAPATPLPYDQEFPARPPVPEEPTPRKPILRMPFKVLAVVTLAIILGLITWTATTTYRDQRAFERAADQYGVTIGTATAPVTVDVYMDFLCPACAQFERYGGATLQKAVDAGKARVRVHPMSFLDRASAGTRYSTRAANAFITAAKAQPDVALRLAQALYAKQPREGGPGLTDKQIADIARSTGVAEDTVATFTDGLNNDFVAQVTQTAFEHDVTGTPTVLVNGKPIRNPSRPGVLAEAIDRLAG